MWESLSKLSPALHTASNGKLERCQEQGTWPKGTSSHSLLQVVQCRFLTLTVHTIINNLWILKKTCFMLATVTQALNAQLRREANRGKWKAGSYQESNLWHLACAVSALRLSYNNHTTTSPQFNWWQQCALFHSMWLVSLKPNVRPHQILPHSIQTLYTMMHMHQTHPPTQTNSLHWGETSKANWGTLKHILKPAPPNITQFYLYMLLWESFRKNTCSTTTSLTEIRQTTLGPLCVLAERGSLETMVQVFWFQISMQQYTMK